LECNSIKSKFNFNSIIGSRFTWIQLKTNAMQIGGECIEYLLVNMLLAKKTSKTHKYEKTHFHVSSLGNGLNKFQFGNVQGTTTWGI